MSLLEHILLAGTAWTENLRKIRGMPALRGTERFQCYKSLIKTNKKWYKIRSGLFSQLSKKSSKMSRIYIGKTKIFPILLILK
jgi:hypothetical protein